MSLTFQHCGSRFRVADCCLRFAKRTRVSLSGSLRLCGITLGGEHVSMDGTLGMINLVSNNADAKWR